MKDIKSKLFLKINPNNFRNADFLIFIIIALIAVVYIPVFGNQLTNWDDDIYILENPYLKTLSFENLKNIFTSYFAGNYHPLTMLSLAIDYRAGGIEPWPYQATNLFLHLCNTLLVYYFVKSLLQKYASPKINYQVIALITATLFGIHTFQVESVAWISERKNVLYTFFFLASLVMYLKYLDNKSRWKYILSVVLFLLSLLSKGMAVPLSLCLIAIDYFANRKLLSAKVILEKVPFLLLSLLFGFIALIAQYSADAISVADQFTWIDRFVIAGYGFIIYLVKLCFPYQLSAFYPYPVKTGALLPYSLYTGAGIALMLLLVVWLFLRKNKMVIFGFLFFIVNISIVIQLLPVGGSIMSDRYVYIPSIGFFFIVGYFYSILLGKMKKIRTGGLVIMIIYLTLLGIKTNQRIGIWKDSHTLWSDAIKNYPENNDRACLSLGVLSYEKGNYSEASKYYSRVLQMNINNKKAFGLTYVNMGLVKMALNDNKGALIDFNKSLSCNISYEAYYNRAILKMKLGNADDALMDLDSATLIDPFIIGAYIDRGNILFQKEKYNEALLNFEKVLQIDPDNGSAYFGRGRIKKVWNDNQGAMEDFNTALLLKPIYEGYLNRAALKYSDQDIEGALDDLNEASLINPKGFEVPYNKGYIYQNTGKMQIAIKEYSKAIEINPNDFEIYLHRAMANFELANYQSALTDLNKSIELQQNASAYYYRGLTNIRLGNKTNGCSDLNKSASMGNNDAQIEINKNCN